MGSALGIVVIAAIVGLIFGSFLTVCIFRIPHGRYEPVDAAAETLDDSEEPKLASDTYTILSPARSFCPKCKAHLSWYHNVPLFSWLFLRGRCYSCKEPIPARYPLVEVLTSFMTVLTVLNFGPTPTGFLVFAFGCALIVITFIDIDYMIIPDVISLPGCLIGVAIGALQGMLTSRGMSLFAPPVVQDLTESLFGFFIGAGVLYTIAYGYLWLRGRDGMGLGDVKLLALIGVLFGPQCTVFTLMASSVLAVVCVLPFVLLRRRNYSQYLPFGPYIAIAAFFFVIDGFGIYDFLKTGAIPEHWWLASTKR